jgi:hypothetical protein
LSAIQKLSWVFSNRGTGILPVFFINRNRQDACSTNIYQNFCFSQIETGRMPVPQIFIKISVAAILWVSKKVINQ